MLPIKHSKGASQASALRNSRASHRLSQVRAGPVLWSRTPDAWDAQVEQEEAERRLAHQQEWQRRAQEDASEWRAQVDATHNELLARQKQRAALRDRVQQDAERAKQQQLKRIESVARARAKAKGLATMGLDPEILALSSKFMRLDAVVDQVQARMEEEYGLADVPTRRFAGPATDPSLPSRAMPAAAGRWEGGNSTSSSSGSGVSTSGAARLGPGPRPSGPGGNPLVYAEDASSSGPASIRRQQLEASVPPATSARMQSSTGAPASDPAKRRQQQTEEGAGASAAPTAAPAPGIQGSGWSAATSGGAAVGSSSKPVQLQSRAQPRPQPQDDSQGPSSSRPVAANPAAVAARPSVAAGVNMSDNRRTGGAVSLQPDASTSSQFPASAVQVQGAQQGAYARPLQQWQLQEQQRPGAYGSGVATVRRWPAQQQPVASTSQRSRPQPVYEASTSNSGANGTQRPRQPQEQQWPVQQQQWPNPQQQPQEYQQGQQLPWPRQQQPLQRLNAQQPHLQQQNQQYQAPYQPQQQRAQQTQQQRPAQQRSFPQQQVQQQQQGRPSGPMPRAGRATADVYYGIPEQAQEPVPWWRQVLNKLT